MSERAAQAPDRRVVMLVSACLAVAFAALLWPSAADAQRALRKPCLDPKRTLTVAQTGGAGSYTGREPLLNCVAQTGATTFTAQQTCTFHCQHWHTWVPTGVPFAPNIQLSATPAAGSHLWRWSDNCVPTLAQARTDCTVRVAGNTTVTAEYGPAPDAGPPAPPGGVTVTPSSYSAVVRWSPVADAYLGGYEVYRSGSANPVARVGRGATQVTVGNLSCLTAYAFRVVAFDMDNESSSGEVAATTGRCGPTKPPNTALHLVPPKSTKARGAFFHFGTRGSIRATKYQCKLDRGRWTRCSGNAGKRYKKLRPGVHTFRVRAGNAVGWDRTPASYRWRVRR